MIITAESLCKKVAPNSNCMVIVKLDTVCQMWSWTHFHKCSKLKNAQPCVVHMYIVYIVCWPTQLTIKAVTLIKTFKTREAYTNRELNMNTQNGYFLLYAQIVQSQDFDYFIDTTPSGYHSLTLTTKIWNNFQSAECNKIM